jgi:hypothetical protein
LTATRIVSIFDDVLAIAISTSVNNKFGYHIHTILQYHFDLITTKNLSIANRFFVFWLLAVC